MGLFSILSLLFSTWAYDDPFITYRYAHNLAHGLGFVYNPGERVLSTTTPLLALLLAPFSFFKIDLQITANLIGAASIALGGWLFWQLGHAWRTPWVGRAGLLLYPTFGLLLGTIGSETPIYLTLCLGAFTAFARQHYLWMAFAAALAALARPDGLLVAVILALAFGADALRGRVSPRGRSLWAAILLFGGILSLWAVFAWLYFGSPVPVTLAAKQGQGMMSISQKFLPGFLRVLNNHNRWEYWLMGILALLGLGFRLSRARPWGVILLWTAAYFAGYTALGVSRYFWYYTPLVPGFILLMGLGLEMLSRLRFGAWLAALILLICFLPQAATTWNVRQRVDPRYRIYRAVGEWLTENTPPQATVGTLEVGIVGYYAQRPIVDFAGLIQPPVARQMGPTTTYDDTALWAIQAYLPDYLALISGALPKTDQWAEKFCEKTKVFAGSEYNFNADVILYTCP